MYVGCGKWPKEAAIMETPKTAEFAHIGKSVIIKGELSGSEALTDRSGPT